MRILTPSCQVPLTLDGPNSQTGIPTLDSCMGIPLPRMRDGNARGPEFELMWQRRFL